MSSRLFREVGASSPGEEVEMAGVADKGEAFITITRKVRSRQLLITSLPAGLSLSAARPVVHKSIFHVDNASGGCKPSDIIDHLKLLDIPVVSCFECKSWRKLGFEEITSRAFHLYVEKEIANKILDKEICHVTSWQDRGNSNLLRPRSPL